MKKKNKRFLLIKKISDSFEEKIIFNFKDKFFYFFLIFFIFLISFFSLIMFNTIFSKWLNPFHFYNINKDNFDKITFEISSLEEKCKQNDLYLENLQSIISDFENSKEIIEKKEEKIFIKKKIKKKDKNDYSQIIFFNPLNGSIIEDSQNIFEIKMKADENSNVCSIYDGIIVFSEKIDTNYKTIIQHENGYLSIYTYEKKNSKIKKGSMIFGGDVIGFTGQIEKNKNFNFIFEVYCNGKVIDPRKIIVF